MIPRDAHEVSARFVSNAALRVLETLQEHGFEAFLVGGCVRDLMLGREPKDFDVVTNAVPEQIKALFRRSRLIGRRFRLAHVRFGRDVIEVSTYRALPRSGDTGAAPLRDDNTFGTQEEDARRRDLTVNALYFDNRNDQIIDYVGGAADLEQGLIRVIGDPSTRFCEDPVRLLRAVRFAARLSFRIDEATARAIPEVAPRLAGVPPARLFEEVLKLFHGGYALQTWELLRKYQLFEPLFPQTERSLEREREGYPLTMVPRALANTDHRVREGKPVTPAFLLAVLLWDPVRLEMQEHIAGGMPENEALRLAAQAVVRQQQRSIAIPRRFVAIMVDIWHMQRRFEQRRGKRPFRLLDSRTFRAAYDFMLLRAEAGEVAQELCDWWTRFQEVDPQQQRAMTGEGPQAASPRRHKVDRPGVAQVRDDPPPPDPVRSRVEPRERRAARRPATRRTPTPPAVG